MASFRAENLYAPLGTVDLRAHSTDAVRRYYAGLLDRIDAAEPEISAFLPEQNRRRRVLLDLEQLLTRFGDATPSNRPPLFAMPLGVKDLFRAEGFETRAGSRLPPELFAGPEAEAVTRLKEAGVVVVGKTVTTEFAYFAPGPTRNPWRLDHTPGGSSSGSAAAVAAGMVAVALGTQTIGSINRPAAFCGIVGYKPSYGLAPTHGVVPFSHSSDHVGLLGPDVATVAAAGEVLCGSTRATRREAATPRFFRAGGAYEEQAEPEARNAVSTLIRALREAGQNVKERDLLPGIEGINKDHGLMIAREFAEVHAGWAADYRNQYSPKSLELIEKGRLVEDASYKQACSGRERLRHALGDMIGEDGVVLTPSAPGTAPAGIEATGSPVMNLPWTYAGLPTVTVPLTVSQNGLPTAVQLVARFGSDRFLLDVAAKIEALVEFAP